jgi:hypothetical protein
LLLLNRTSLLSDETRYVSGETSGQDLLGVLGLLGVGQRSRVRVRPWTRLPELRAAQPWLGRLRTIVGFGRRGRVARGKPTQPLCELVAVVLMS